MIQIHAIGALKSGPEHDLCQTYLQRLGGAVKVHDYEIKEKNDRVRQEKESEALLSALTPRDHLILLDERGKNLSTLELNALIQKIQIDLGKTPTFAIGGADGHCDFLKKKAGHLVSFGALTWPHKLVRVLLLEQLYRCQQINAGHPYHRG